MRILATATVTDTFFCTIEGVQEEWQAREQAAAKFGRSCQGDVVHVRSNGHTRNPDGTFNYSYTFHYDQVICAEGDDDRSAREGLDHKIRSQACDPIVQTFDTSLLRP